MDIFVVYQYNNKLNKVFEVYFESEKECIQYVDVCREIGLDPSCYYEVKELLKDDDTRDKSFWINHLAQFV